MRLVLLAVLLVAPALAQESAPPPPETAPVETAPAETAPAETAPAETAPAETAPAETAPVETAPVGPAPVGPAPAERVPAALEAEPAVTEEAPVAASVGAKVRERRVGDPVPLTRREPTVNALGFMFGLRYGLVGTAPTRFVDDIRFGITDTIELRTALLPYPSSLMVRARLGSSQSSSGAFLVDAGLAHWDAGLRIVPDTGEATVGMRFHAEGGVGYVKALGERFAVRGQAHYRYRLSLLPDDDQHAAAVDAHLTYDLLDALAVSAGLGVATTIGTPVRELAINFVETDAPGISHLLARGDGLEQSVTIPLSLTYGRVESF